MTPPDPAFFLETLTLPLENPLAHAQLWSEWTMAYPTACPLERGLLEHALRALIEVRRLARVRATLRTGKPYEALEIAIPGLPHDRLGNWTPAFSH